jgi:lipoprotein NlpI
MSETYFLLSDQAANRGDTAQADRLWRIATALARVGR